MSSVYHLAVTYQPVSRYWAFQSIEPAIYLGLSLALCGFCFCGSAGLLNIRVQSHAGQSS